jgi:two-component system sensor histidine kinase PilS (NtrC family)
MRTEPAGILRSGGVAPANRIQSPKGAIEPALVLFQVYRLVMASLFAGLFLFGLGPRFLGQTDPQIYAWTSLSYLALVLASLVLMRNRLTAQGALTHFIVYSDVVAFSLMMYASGGVASGLGMLSAVSVAAGSLLSGGRTALVFAASATLGVLGVQIYAAATLEPFDPVYSQAGMLGGLMFAMALLAHTLGTRASRSAELASRRGADLANLERLNEYIIQHAETGILVVDHYNRVRLANEAALKLLEQPGAGEGASLVQISPELTGALVRWQADPKSEIPPLRDTPSGQPLRAGFAPVGEDGAGTIITLQDYSALTRRAQREKLVSLGRLTASIAHEIRNPLGAVSHASQLLGESPKLSAPERRLTEIIQTNALRLNAIIENVLQLSRPNVYQPRGVRLQACVNEFAEEFRQHQGLAADGLEVRFDAEDIRVNVDPKQMHQVLDILCDNALTHSPQDRAVRIQIRGGRSADTGAPYLDVIDNGPGVPPEVAEQIFEPFFTSRHKGTGLGLYIAKELSAGNQAELSYLPRPEGGSCFRLLFRGSDNRQKAMT